MKDFAEIIRKRYYQEDNLVTCPNITLQVTDDCCLNCSYCYQTNKGHHMMSFDTAKQCIDLLFKMYDENNPNALINHHTKGIILDFIGGEPFLNIDVIHQISEYFINLCIAKDHQWLTNFKFNMTSNGILYFNSKVQNYLNQFQQLINLNITIDGPQDLHDSCRKDFDNIGSFDRAFSAFQDWKKRTGHASTKVTIAPENLPYLHEIVDFFIKENCFQINANPIFEHPWTIEEAKLYYSELKSIADKLLINPHISTNLFGTAYGVPLLSSDLNNWCGGTGKMLAFDFNGIAYPCIRYMESSLGDKRKPIIIGNTQGIYNTVETQSIYKEFQNFTRRSQSTDECFNCSIAGGCAWCSAWNYQEFGTVNKKSTNICWMHRARSLANSYYYNKKFILEKSEKRIPLYLNRSIANQIISDEEYDKLLRLCTIR